MALNELRLFRRLTELVNTRHDLAYLPPNVQQVWTKASSLASTTVLGLPEFTLHDSTHLNNVADLISRLLPDAVLEALSPIELAGLLMAVAIHDLGMTAPRAEIDALMRAPSAESPSEEQVQYLIHRERSPELIRRKAALEREGSSWEAVQVEYKILADYIRGRHGERVRNMVNQHFRSETAFGQYHFNSMLTDICTSHTSPPDRLRDLPVAELVLGDRVNWRFIALLLRLGDILDFDSSRTPKILFEHLAVRDEVSVSEWRKHRAITGWEVRPGVIAFAAQCPDPVIEKAIRDFLDLIDIELRSARSILADFHHPMVEDLADRYYLDLPLEVDRTGVMPRRNEQGLPEYDFVDSGFRLDHDSVMDLLMGVKLYGHKKLFLRELLQNSVDACRYRMAAETLPSYEPAIKIELILGQDNVLIVSDNGMGMTKHIIMHYFAKIGRSYYRSPDFLSEELAIPELRPVARFGIGVLSCFMASDKLIVSTRSRQAGHAAISVEIASRASLFWFKPGTRSSPGTDIQLTLRTPLRELFRPDQGSLSSNPSAEEVLSALVRTVERIAPRVAVPISCRVHENGGEVRGRVSIQPFNTDGLWTEDEIALVSFDVDLTKDGPAGLDGRIRFFIMVDDSGAPTEWVAGMGSEVGPHNRPRMADGQVAARWYQQIFGGIQKTTMMRRGGGSGGTSEMLRTGRRRVSQQGFLVSASDLLGGRRGTGSPLHVLMPFACSYDINLSEEFILPLNVDRRDFAPEEGARPICAEIERVVIRLMLRVASPSILEYQSFFRALPSASPTTRAAEVYRQGLEIILDSGEVNG